MVKLTRRGRERLPISLSCTHPAIFYPSLNFCLARSSRGTEYEVRSNSLGGAGPGRDLEAT